MWLIRLLFCTMYVFSMCFCTSLFSGILELRGHGRLDYSCIIGDESGKNFINIYLNNNTIMKSKNSSMDSHITSMDSSDCISIFSLPIAVIGKCGKQVFWLCKDSEVGKIKKDYSKLNFILQDCDDDYILLTSEDGAAEWFALFQKINRNHYDEREVASSYDELKLELDYDCSLSDSIAITMNPIFIFNILYQQACLDISDLEIFSRHKWFSKFTVTLICEGSLADDSACVVFKFLPKSCYGLSINKAISLKFAHCDKKIKKVVELKDFTLKEVKSLD